MKRRIAKKQCFLAATKNVKKENRTSPKTYYCYSPRCRCRNGSPYGKNIRMKNGRQDRIAETLTGFISG